MKIVVPSYIPAIAWRGNSRHRQSSIVSCWSSITSIIPRLLNQKGISRSHKRSNIPLYPRKPSELGYQPRCMRIRNAATPVKTTMDCKNTIPSCYDDNGLLCVAAWWDASVGMSRLKPERANSRLLSRTTISLCGKESVFKNLEAKKAQLLTDPHYWWHPSHCVIERTWNASKRTWPDRRASRLIANTSNIPAGAGGDVQWRYVFWTVHLCQPIKASTHPYVTHLPSRLQPNVTSRPHPNFPL